MTEAAGFHADYAAALRRYLVARDEDTLAVGHELGRRALQDQISMLEIIESELTINMKLLGASSCDDLDGTYLQPATPVTAPGVLSTFPLL